MTNNSIAYVISPLVRYLLFHDVKTDVYSVMVGEGDKGMKKKENLVRKT